MNYIYNKKHIHNNYMFHDKELSVNDIVWGYEPKGKRMFKYNEISKCYKGKMQLTIGTGKVIAKYKVVEVYSGENYLDDLVGNMSTETFKKWCDVGKEYAYKLEKIEDVSMELSEFSVISKIDKGIYGECGNNLEGCNLCDHNGECPIQFNNMVNATLTRYNGLTQVILRSDER